MTERKSGFHLATLAFGFAGMGFGLFGILAALKSGHGLTGVVASAIIVIALISLTMALFGLSRLRNVGWGAIAATVILAFISIGLSVLLAMSVLEDF